eukprot:3656347-Prymnesium_polylepis.1
MFVQGGGTIHVDLILPPVKPSAPLLLRPSAAALVLQGDGQASAAAGAAGAGQVLASKGVDYG